MIQTRTRSRSDRPGPANIVTVGHILVSPAALDIAKAELGDSRGRLNEGHPGSSLRSVTCPIGSSRSHLDARATPDEADIHTTRRLRGEGGGSHDVVRNGLRRVVSPTEKVGITMPGRATVSCSRRSRSTRLGSGALINDARTVVHGGVSWSRLQ